MDHPKCQGLILGCLDYRIQATVSEFSRQRFDGLADYLALAGGPKKIVDRATRSQVVEQIKLAVSLHEMKTIVLMGHQDCGAYGGSTAFENLTTEISHLVWDIFTARNELESALASAQITIDVAFLTYTGDNWKINLADTNEPHMNFVKRISGPDAPDAQGGN